MKVTRFVAIALLLLAIFWIRPAAAEVPVSAYLSAVNTKDGKELMRTYVAGMLSGFVWANADLESRKQTALFCPPRHLSLNMENAIALLDEWTKHPEFDFPSARGLPISGVLLSALRKEFPCK